MALENITLQLSDLIIGIVMLVIGCIMMAVNTQLQRPYNLILLIGGAALAIIGVVVVILAFI